MLVVKCITRLIISINALTIIKYTTIKLLKIVQFKLVEMKRLQVAVHLFLNTYIYFTNELLDDVEAASSNQ